MRRKKTSNAFRTDRKSGWNTRLFSVFRDFTPAPQVTTPGFSCGSTTEKKNDHLIMWWSSFSYGCTVPFAVASLQSCWSFLCLRNFLLFLPWNFFWLQIKRDFWTEHIENPILEAELVGISVGIVLDAFDDAVVILDHGPCTFRPSWSYNPVLLL